MSVAAPVSRWELPGDPGEVLAVYVDGVEIARADWTADGARLMLRAPVPVQPTHRGEALAEALAWVGRYPPRTTVTAIVWRSGGSYVVDAWPAQAE